MTCDNACRESGGGGGSLLAAGAGACAPAPRPAPSEHGSSAGPAQSAELPFDIPPVLHIDGIDWGALTLSTNDGRVFEELSDGTWIEVAPVSQGSVRWWGGGCHSGQINLTPLYVYWNGSWTSTVTGKVCTTPVVRKHSKAPLALADEDD